MKPKFDRSKLILASVNRSSYDSSGNVRVRKRMSKESYLKKHKFKISEKVEKRAGGEITRWRTFLPDENGKKGKELIKSSREDLENALVEFYSNQNKADVYTFGDMFWKWADHNVYLNGLSKNTEDKYKTDYNRFIRGKELEKKDIRRITANELEMFILDCIKTYECRDGSRGLEYKPFTKLYGYIENTFKYAVRFEYMHRNPMDKLEKAYFRNACKPPKEKTAETELVSKSDFDLILSQIYKDIEEKPLYFPEYAVEFCAKTGLRAGEVAALKWSDVDAENGYITICRSDKYNKERDENGKIISHSWTIGETKTKKKRRFPIDGAIKASLKRLRTVQDRNNIQSEFLFPHPDYGWSHSGIISSCLKNICKRAGCSRMYGIHAFRKTLNTDMRNQNASAKLCASMIGNTEEVNDKHYYYDTSSMEEKRNYLELVHGGRAYA